MRLEFSWTKSPDTAAMRMRIHEQVSVLHRTVAVREIQPTPLSHRQDELMPTFITSIQSPSLEMIRSVKRTHICACVRV